jgi:two-component system cell cycle response regulator
MAATIETKTRADLDAMIANIEELPTIPETLLEILRLIDDPASGARDLARVVRVDAPLAAKIIRLANSPYYGGRGRVSDISRCIALIGYRTMRNVAVCLTVATNLMSAVARAGGRLDYRALWYHSVATGAIAKHLAGLVPDQDPEDMFSAGLLHDLGKFVIELHAPARYDKVVFERARSGVPLVAAERACFGFDHTDVGAAFARAWCFPRFLARCAGEHHTDLAAADPGHPADRAVALVALADYLARSDLGFDPAHCDAARLHAAAGLAVAEVEAELGRMQEAVRLAGYFANITERG